MKTMKRGTGLTSRLPRLAAVVLAILAVPAVDSALAAAQSPEEVVRTRNDAVSRVLDGAEDPIEDQTRELLKDVINDLIDFRELSRRALGRHWDERTDEEQREFERVFRDLIRNSSVQRLGIYRADSIAYHPTEASDGEAIVRTVAYRDGQSVEIRYHLHQVDGEWKAFDVVIDGSSTLRTYRDSFNRELSRTSFTAMLDRLAERVRGG